MISKQKYIVTLVIIIGLLSVIYFNASQSDELKKSVPQSGTDINTGKILNIASQSGGQWGDNPFGTGKSNSNEIQKLEFKKPNTEWKPRTLSGITYRFGEGNPREVALDENKLKAAHKKCGTIEDPENSGILCRENSGYVSPEAEKHLLLALSDPNWTPLMILCEDNLRVFEPENLEIPNNPSYDRILYENFLDIEYWMSIDTNTGQKKLNMGRLLSLQEWLIGRTASAWNDIEFPRQSDGITLKVFKNPKCVDLYGTEIIRNLRLSATYYTRPPEVF
jgi:hypothetical protein